MADCKHDWSHHAPRCFDCGIARGAFFEAEAIRLQGQIDALTTEQGLRDAFHALADKHKAVLQIQYNGTMSISDEDTWPPIEYIEEGNPTLKRVEAEGVGDNDGFFELGGK